MVQTSLSPLKLILKKEHKSLTNVFWKSTLTSQILCWIWNADSKGNNRAGPISTTSSDTALQLQPAFSTPKVAGRSKICKSPLQVEITMEQPTLGQEGKGYGWPIKKWDTWILVGAWAAAETSGQGWQLSSAVGTESSKSWAILLRNSRRRQLLMQELHGEQKPLHISPALSLSGHEECDGAPRFGIEELLSSWPSMQLHHICLSHPILFPGNFTIRKTLKMHAYRVG